MKNIKKVLCLALALMMVFTVTCTTAFAEDSGDNHEMPEGLIRTTIEITVEPGEDADIMPLIWDQKNPTVGNGYSRTSSFVVPERYFAYEASATDAITGEAVDGTVVINLYQNDCLADSNGIPINGKTYKADWIDLHGSNSTCYFKLRSNSDDFVSVVLTYYSWA